MFRKGAFLFVGAALLAGCGGSGSNSGIRPTTNLLRELQVGDRYVHRVQVTIDRPNDREESTATSTNEVVLRDLTGTPTRAIFTTGGGFDTYQYFDYAEGTGDMMQVGSEFGEGATRLDPPLFQQFGIFVIGNTYETKGEGSNRTSMAVRAYETVTVPAGTFQTFRVDSVTMNEFGATATRSWIAPALGFVVKSESISADDTMEDEPQTTTSTVELISTNVR